MRACSRTDFRRWLEGYASIDQIDAAQCLVKIPLWNKSMDDSFAIARQAVWWAVENRHEQVGILIRHADVWVESGSENPMLPALLRQRHGIREALFDSPGHIFEVFELYEAFTMAQFALISSWEVDIYARYGRWTTLHRTKAMYLHGDPERDKADALKQAGESRKPETDN